MTDRMFRAVVVLPWLALVGITLVMAYCVVGF